MHICKSTQSKKKKKKDDNLVFGKNETIMVLWYFCHINTLSNKNTTESQGTFYQLCISEKKNRTKMFHMDALIVDVVKVTSVQKRLSPN